jgi:hypothetical protein
MPEAPPEHGSKSGSEPTERTSIYPGRDSTVLALRPSEAPARPEPMGKDVPHARFRRGAARPRAVAWFGIRSFYGHLWHLAASAIATQDIDSRDWMHADDPETLTKSVARVIDPAAPDAPSVTEALGRDVFLDYIADTGDDKEVSRAVAELVAQPYEVPSPDGGSLTAPRGDILLFGGDTAYPVATATEIEARLLSPWNAVLTARDDHQKRALLGIPGNHDWFDGLDGFARMFRARAFRLERDRARAAAPGAERPVRHLVSWIEAFAMGKHVVKRRALPLFGYEPVQRASYFALSLAPGRDLWGVDRQLRQVNFQQRKFFWERRNAEPKRSLVLCLPDPLREYLKPSRVGAATLQALELDPIHDPMLCIAGDVHHYERWQFGPSIHLVSGGGGAFLHGARSARRGLAPPICEFPGPRASRALLRGVPFRVATGAAGLIPHLALAVLFAPALGLGLRFGPGAMGMASQGAAALCALVCAFLGGWRRGQLGAVALLALLTGAAMGAVPLVAREAFRGALRWLGASPSPKVGALVVFAMAIVIGAWVFGCYLAALAWLGLNNEQAFAALGHPGYRHFVRMRIRQDGSAVDGWVIGLVDPLGDRTPVLVDTFTFK